ncbi:hypothetical protein ANCCAN_22536 [Ancylostoma caninum]|uniref:Leishmanolysin-like peptidase n=1 Tax=Ancylostoma caninum TaxID=29170 RepID=A0A368FHI9_ANCCA|nr:hypothetical protein ANCCAN_22536 [Ancylostoma caninum]
MIVSPKVREEARRFFNCPDLEGAELESQGGAGSAFAHWEKRIFEHEAMSAISTAHNAFSRITLALFEDSGWYQVNYKCSANRKDKLRCNMVLGSKGLPTQFDYNAPDMYKDKKGRPIQGRGLLAFADYCPYYRVQSTLLEKGSYDTKCTLPDNMNYNNYSLEIFSPSARCFELDGGIAVQREQNTDIWLHNVGCYETKCEEGLLLVKTQKSKFYPCYKRGQLVHVEKLLGLAIAHLDFEEYITCLGHEENLHLIPRKLLEIMKFAVFRDCPASALYVPKSSVRHVWNFVGSSFVSLREPFHRELETVASIRFPHP